jgi:hypothetical protein
MDNAALAPFRIFLAVAACIAFIPIFRSFVWNNPPKERSERIFVFVRECLGAVVVALLVAYGWGAFKGWLLAVTVLCFLICGVLFSDLRRLFTAATKATASEGGRYKVKGG